MSDGNRTKRPKNRYRVWRSGTRMCPLCLHIFASQQAVDEHLVISCPYVSVEKQR